jgi:hypothetical protein
MGSDGHSPSCKRGVNLFLACVFGLKTMTKTILKRLFQEQEIKGARNDVFEYQRNLLPLNTL